MNWKLGSWFRPIEVLIRPHWVIIHLLITSIIFLFHRSKHTSGLGFGVFVLNLCLGFCLCLAFRRCFVTVSLFSCLASHPQLKLFDTTLITTGTGGQTSVMGLYDDLSILDLLLHLLQTTCITNPLRGRWMEIFLDKNIDSNRSLSAVSWDSIEMMHSSISFPLNTLSLSLRGT